jgi:hypothetical protein
MYVNENGNGKKKPGILLGEIATDFLGATIPNPLLASAFRVASRNVTALPSQPRPATLPGIYGVLQRKLDAKRAAPVPSINVATLPNGTAVPAEILPPSNGNGSSGPVYYSNTGGGGSPPVEVGTLPDGGDGDSTGPSLAGLTSGSPMLLLAAVAAFFLLGDSKRKRRR